MRHRFTAIFAALFLVGLGLSSPSHAGPAGPAAAEGVEQPPNVMLISTDDMHVDDLKYMPITRRLIGAQGTTFTDALSPYPLCCPARATLLTGLFNHNNGVVNNNGPFGGYGALLHGDFADETIPTWLNDTTQGADYETAFIGKFLNGYGGERRPDGSLTVPKGWDYFAAGVEGTGLYNQYSGEINVLDRSAGEREATLESTNQEYRTYWNNQRVIDRIEHADATDSPFFIWQSELAPHGSCWPNEGGGCTWGPPMSAPEDQEKFLNLALRTQQTPGFNERAIADKPDYIRKLPRFTQGRIDRIREYNRARVQSLQSVDRSVGQTVRKLEELGRLDNTLIIFTSDNGYVLGEHRYTGKTVAYEPSLRVPLLMRGPGVPVGKTVAATTSLVDIAATVADVAKATPALERDGVPVPLDGRSLLPIANGRAPGWSAIPVEAGWDGATSPDQWWYRGVRTKRYVYVEYEQSKEAELYDLRTDPYQLDNLAYRPTAAATRAAMAAKLQRLRGCSGAVCRSENGGGVPQPLSDGTPVHPDELAGLGSATQVVTLTAPAWGSTKGTAVAWRKVGRSWRVARGPFQVQLGSDGLARPGVRQPKDRTPAGAFKASAAMGLEANPGTAMRYRVLDGNDYWPFDASRPRSYNVFQPRRTEKARWSERQSVRWAAEPKRYPYALVMSYNLGSRVHRSARTGEMLARVPADVRKGSFVLHAGTATPRQGWVSMPARSMRWLLRWTDPAKHGTSFVVGTPDYLRNRL